MQNATSTVLSQALGQGGSLNEALKSALYNSFAAAGFNFVGDIGQEYSLKPGDPSMVTMHALMGGLAAQVSGGDFATGAAAAGANEALVAKLDQAFKSLSPENREAMVTMGSQLVGVLAAAVRDPDVTGKALESAAWVAKNSTQYNFLNHQDVADLDNALQKCKSQGNCRQVEEEFKARSDENRRRLNGCVAVGNCAEIRAEIDAGSTALNELVARQETANPGGSDSDIAYGFLMGRNVVDWTTAGQLHLEQTANLWWNGNPQWQKEVGAYLDQTGFNPFGIGVPAMGGAAGKVTAKALMNALKAGELPKGEVAPGRLICLPLGRWRMLRRECLIPIQLSSPQKRLGQQGRLRLKPAQYLTQMKYVQDKGYLVLGTMLRTKPLRQLKVFKGSELRTCMLMDSVPLMCIRRRILIRQR